MRLEIYRMYKTIRDHGICVDPRRILPVVSLAAADSSEEPDPEDLDKEINEMIREIHVDEGTLRDNLDQLGEAHKRSPEGGVASASKRPRVWES